MSEPDIDQEGVSRAEEAAARESAARQLEVRKEAPGAVLSLLLERSLYSKIEGDQALIAEVDEIINGTAGLQFDLYCETCGQVTPWTIKASDFRSSGGGAGQRYTVPRPVPKIRVVNAVCLRLQHFYTYVLYRDGLLVQKIGQKPSMADIAHGELKSIAGINEQDRKELGRALGLFAHDAPLGAFVYLRRVFERMVERAHEHYKETHGSYIENWHNLRREERVRALGNALPPEVTVNSGIFGLLSKGIHELSDEDAETLFPLVKAVIFQMLGDEERHRQAAKARLKTNKALQAAIARHKPAP